jgi:hypothetical protein
MESVSFLSLPKIILINRMDLSYPTIATAALFAVIFILDIRNNEYKKLFLHFLFSAICILLITYLYENGYSFVAWTLLISPFILIFIAASLQPTLQVVLPSVPVSHPTRKCAPGCPKPSCECKKTSTATPTVEPAPSGTCGPNGNSPRCINVDSLPSV